MTYRVLCPLALERRDPGATRELGSATANLGLEAQAAATVCPAIGGLEMKDANPAHVLTAVMR